MLTTYSKNISKNISNMYNIYGMVEAKLTSYKKQKSHSNYYALERDEVKLSLLLSLTNNCN